MSDVTEEVGEDVVPENKVKLIKMGKASVEISLAKGATLDDALALIDEVLGKRKAYVNGEEISGDTELNDGDTASILPPVKGGRR